jgi:hypothetical protein
LHSVRNRLAIEGEPLQVHRFHTSSLGLASITDLQISAAMRIKCARAGWWEAIKNWFKTDVEQSLPAVCIPPGTRLMLREIAPPLQEKFGLSAEEEVTFISARSHTAIATRFASAMGRNS